MNSISPNEPATQWCQTIVINGPKKISQKSLRAMCRNRNSKCSDILLERMFSAKKKKNGECLWQLWVLVSILNCWVFSNRFLGSLWLWISRRTLSVSVRGTETSAPHFVITRSTNILQNLQKRLWRVTYNFSQACFIFLPILPNRRYTLAHCNPRSHCEYSYKAKVHVSDLDN